MSSFAQLRPALLFTLVLLLSSVVTLGIAQKKKKETPPPAPAATEQPAPVPGKAPATIREVLLSIKGQETNLGMLSRVANDYVVFEYEGDTLMYPIGVLQVVKFLKPEEEGAARKIEFKFLSKD